MPQPKHKPTDEQRKKALHLAMVCTPHKHIADLMGINLRTLLKYYDPELTLGKAQGVSTLCKTLYQMALDPKEKSRAAMVIFALKVHAGFREVQVVEQSGPNGGAVRVKVDETISADKASRDYLELMGRIRGKP